MTQQTDRERLTEVETQLEDLQSRTRWLMVSVAFLLVAVIFPGLARVMLSLTVLVLIIVGLISAVFWTCCRLWGSPPTSEIPSAPTADWSVPPGQADAQR